MIGPTPIPSVSTSIVSISPPPGQSPVPAAGPLPPADLDPLSFLDPATIAAALGRLQWTVEQELELYTTIAKDASRTPKERTSAARSIRQLLTDALRLSGALAVITDRASLPQAPGSLLAHSIEMRRIVSAVSISERLLRGETQALPSPPAELLDMTQEAVILNESPPTQLGPTVGQKGSPENDTQQVDPRPRCSRPSDPGPDRRGHDPAGLLPADGGPARSPQPLLPQPQSQPPVPCPTPGGLATGPRPDSDPGPLPDDPDEPDESDPDS